MLKNCTDLLTYINMYYTK